MSLDEKQREEFWCVADKNGDGELTIQELCAAVKKYQPSNPGPNYRPPTTQDICCMFSDIDKDGDNRITKAEFMGEMQKPSRSETLLKAFKEMDANGDGTLSHDEVKQLVRKSGVKGNVEETANSIISCADTSGDGVISYDEFLKALA